MRSVEEEGRKDTRTCLVFFPAVGRSQQLALLIGSGGHPRAGCADVSRA